MEGRKAWLVVALAAISLVVSAYVLGESLRSFRTADRYVTVKGLAEREVPADLAVWSLAVQATGNDLAAVQDELTADEASVRRFLGSLRFEDAALSVTPVQITDFEARGYGGQSPPPARYLAEKTLTLRTRNVEQVWAAVERSGELVQAGVVLASSYQSGTDFLFTRLNDIKPEMIAEATANARKAAGQFARDAGSRVGAIRHARQGLFTIEDRDRYTPEVKRVRVVTTVEYFLEES